MRLFSTSFATQKAMKKILLVADRAFNQAISQFAIRLYLLCSVLSGPVVRGYREIGTGATWFNCPKSQNSPLVDHAGRTRCLVSIVGLAKLTAKGEPLFQDYSKAKSWRILSKIFPVEQLH